MTHAYAAPEDRIALDMIVPVPPGLRASDVSVARCHERARGISLLWALPAKVMMVTAPQRFTRSSGTAHRQGALPRTWGR
jgi:hypothetical protein